MKVDAPITECPNCGARLESDSVYCPNCNYMLVKDYSDELLSRIRSLEQENLKLRRQLWKLRRRPSRLAGTILSLIGIIAIATSILYESNILAFIGLGLTFWGILLLFIRPVNYVRSELMEATTKSYYDLIQRLLIHLSYKGDPIYLPPRGLRALKTGVIFIGTDNSQENLESIISGGIPEDRLFIIEPQGVCVVAPGLNLANMLEIELDRDFTRTDLDFLQTNLMAAIVEDFEIAEDIEMEVKNDEIKVKIRKSIYESFYVNFFDDKIKRIGCPLVSSIAIALTRSMDRPLMVQEIISESENNSITVTYKLLGGATS